MQIVEEMPAGTTLPERGAAGTLRKIERALARFEQDLAVLEAGGNPGGYRV